MTRGRLRPGRPTAGLGGHLIVALGGLALAAATGAAWLYVAAVLVTVGLLPSVGLAVLGAARARIEHLQAPAVAIAGESARLAVRLWAPRPVVVEAWHGGALLGRCGLVAGHHDGTLAVIFPARAVVDELEVRVRCSSPFGAWPWERRWRALLDPVLAVGPAPIPTPVPTPSDAAHEADAEGRVSAPRRAEVGMLRGVRDWADGDPIGWVHWPTSLRTGELVVREHDPPARTEVAVHLPATATEDDAGRAAGAVDAALHAAWDVRLTVPVASGEHVVRPRDRTEAAEALAHAQLAEPAGPPKQPAPPGVDPVEDRVWARIAVTSTLLVGAGAALGALRWPPVLTAACLLGLPAAGWLSYVNRRRRAPVVVLLSALAVLLVVLRFVGQVGNVQAASFGVARDPLAELLIAILVIHAADLPQRRNLRFAVAASGVLLLYAGAVRVDPGYGPWIVVWAAAAAWALAAVHRSEVRATGPLGHDRADARPATAVAATAGRLALAGAAAGLVTLGLLALVPVPEGPVRLLTPSQVPVRSPVPVPGAIAAGVGATGAGGGGAAGGGSDGGGAGGTIEYTAFEEQFDTSSRGRPGRHVVMRVRAPAPDFWRGQTFERWDGRTWFASEDRGTFRTGPVMEVTGFDGDPRVPLADDELVQTYFLEVPMPNLVFAAYRPTRLYLDAGVWMRPDGGLRADTTLPDGAVYTVVSRRVPVTADDLRRQGAPGAPRLGALWADDEMDRYLQLPDSTTERVRSLALAVTAPYTSVYDKVRALEAWIGANTVYDLAAPVPPPGTDAVDHFLFESRRGFCEQISSALVVMLRAIGVPARVAAGYTPGRWDPFAGVWVVRGENAHAWAEVWFPFTGWQAFDPTAEVPLAGDTLDRGTLGGPMLEAVARALAASAGLLVVLVPVGIAAWLVARVVRRRRRVAAAPVGPAQERFERLARRLDIDIGRADSNPSIARHITERRPDAAAAAVAAAAAIDAAAFGHASPEVAEQAVAELDGILRARSPLAVG